MTNTRTSVKLPEGWAERIASLARAGGRSKHAEILWLIGRSLLTEEADMTLRIEDAEITSPDTAHRAIRITNTMWLVTWLLRDHRVTRNQAITAMTIASTVGATKDRQLATIGGPVDKRDPLWPFIVSWAGELGLDGTSAVLMVSEPPKWEV